MREKIKHKNYFFPVPLACFCLLNIILLIPSLAHSQNSSTSLEDIDNDTCLSCHGDPAENKFIDSEKYTHSVHGNQRCTSCHDDITDIPHELTATDPSSKLYWQNIPQTCGKCHENIKMIYLESVHGKAMLAGKREAPVCTDCHGEHSIEAIKLSTSNVFPSHIPETCGQCHSAERITTKYKLPSYAVETYMESVHGLTIQLGSVLAANCSSCHGSHNILPRTDPRSMIYPQNLPQTCGKCHKGVGPQVAQGQIHSGTRPGTKNENLGVSFVRKFYLILIITVLGGMLIHNCLDFFKKLKIHYLKMKQIKGKTRMNPNERLQHGLLIFTFVVLAYTGFALKYPQAWWSIPFVGRVDWRSFGHRGAALLFCLLTLYHIKFLFFTKRGRWQFNALLFRRDDFLQLIQMFSYFFGKRSKRPALGHYSYIEKIEYWALVWGSIVMTITGSLMLQEAWFLKIFPKWFFDIVIAIHFYEAILASLAIILWHGYFVMFDPDEYPMKWTWITGHSSPSDREHRNTKD